MKKLNSCKKYDYTDLYPNHPVFSTVKCWDGQDSELVHHTCLDDAIEEVIDDCHPDPIGNMGTIQIFGYDWHPDCPEDEYPIEGDPIIWVCLVNVDALEWTKNNRPHWLGEE